MVLAPALLAAAAGAWLSRSGPTPPGAAEEAAGPSQPAPPAPLPGRGLGPSDFVWGVLHEVPDAAVTRGTALLALPDGGVLVAGEVGFLDLNATDLYALALGPAGEMRWERRLEQPWEDACAAVVALPGGGYLLAGDAKVDDRLASDLDLVALDEAGTERWRRRLGQEDRYERAAALAASGGGYLVVGSTEGGVDVALSPAGELVPRITAPAGAGYLARLGADGTLTGERLLPGKGTAALQGVARTADGGFVAAGWTEGAPPDFIDAFLVGLDADGAPRWERALGGPGTQKARAVTALPGGDLVLTGSAPAAEGRGTGLWLARTDPGGEPRWARTFGAGGLEGIAVFPAADGGLRVVGHGRGRNRPDFLYLLRTDGEGTVIEEAHYAPAGDRVIPYAALTLPDGSLVVTGQRGTGLFALQLR
jgi:hypothetical protein